MNLTEGLKIFGHKIVSNEEFNKELDRVIETNKDTCDGTTEGFIPMIIAISTKDEGEKRGLIPIVLMVDDFEENKQKIIFGVGAKIAREHPDFKLAMAFMVTEAWVAGGQNAEDLWSKGVKVSQMDSRKEVLVSAGLTIDARANMAFQDMIRSDDGKFTLGKETKVYYEDKNNGDVQPNLLERFFEGYGYGALKHQAEMKKAAKS